MAETKLLTCTTTFRACLARCLRITLHLLYSLPQSGRWGVWNTSGIHMARPLSGCMPLMKPKDTLGAHRPGADLISFRYMGGLTLARVWSSGRWGSNCSCSHLACSIIEALENVDDIICPNAGIALSL